MKVQKKVHRSRRGAPAAILLTAALLRLAAPASAQPDRAVALTFDDLPLTAVDGRCDPWLAWTTTDRLLAALDARGIRAAGMVNAGRTCGLEPDRLRDPLLERWLDAGHDLGNHTATHPNLDHVPLDDYLADVDAGAAPVDSLLRARGRRLVWFRHPLLHAGDTPAKKAGLAGHLASRDWRVAPVTIDNQEYVYAYVYEVARQRGDTVLQGRVVTAYLDHMDGAFAYFESRSREVLGREIPHVLLLHANRLNADLLPALLDRIEARGYRFVPLEVALADSAYARPDPYLGPSGPSWIERWAVAEGGEAGRGPREDARTAEAFARLRREQAETPGGGSGVEAGPDPRPAIERANAAFSEAFMRGDAATMASLYTEDGILLTPAGRTVAGRAAIERFWTLRPNVRQLFHQLVTEAVVPSGPHGAVEIGAWRSVLEVDGEAGAPATGKYLLTWRRDGDGTWRILADTWQRPEAP